MTTTDTDVAARILGAELTPALAKLSAQHGADDAGFWNRAAGDLTRDPYTRRRVRAFALEAAEAAPGVTFKNASTPTGAMACFLRDSGARAGVDMARAAAGDDAAWGVALSFVVAHRGDLLRTGDDAGQPWECRFQARHTPQRSVRPAAVQPWRALVDELLRKLSFSRTSVAPGREDRPRFIEALSMLAMQHATLAARATSRPESDFYAPDETTLAELEALAFGKAPVGILLLDV